MYNELLNTTSQPAADVCVAMLLHWDMCNYASIVPVSE